MIIKKIFTTAFLILLFSHATSCSEQEFIDNDSLQKQINRLYPEEQYFNSISSIVASSEYDFYKPLVLCHFSDIHGDAVNTARMMTFCQQYSILIDDIICSGDIISNTFDDNFSWWNIIEGTQYILNTIGNHDVADYNKNSGYNWTAHVGIDSYNKFFSPYIHNWNVIQPKGADVNGYCYYYKDYPNSNIRLVVLDVMGYDELQGNWFSCVLEDALEKGLCIIGVSHFAVDDCYLIDCNFTSATLKEKSLLKTSLPNYNLQYKSFRPIASIMDDFIQKGGHFVCWLKGHSHVDYIGYISGHFNQLVISIESASSNEGQVSSARESRKNGTSSQDAFNIIGFNTEKHSIKILRVGNEYDYDGKHKKSILIDYKNNSILEPN